MGALSCHRFASRAPKLWPADVGKSCFLPLRRGEIPMARTGFVIVFAGAVTGCRIPPIVKSDLQQSSGGNLQASFDCASFQSARGKRSSGRRTPEMPDAIRALTYANHGGMLGFVIGARHGFVVVVAAEPGMANIQTSSHAAEVVVEHKILAVGSAGKLSPGNFYLSRLVPRHARVCDGNAPQASGVEIRWPRHRVYVSSLVADFLGNSRVVANDKRKLAGAVSLGRTNRDRGCRDFVRHNRDDCFG